MDRMASAMTQKRPGSLVAKEGMTINLLADEISQKDLYRLGNLAP